MSESNDKDIVIRILNGDEALFNTLTEKHRYGIEKIISSYSYCTEDKNDICQEIFNKAYLSLKSYNPNYAFSTWLYSIAKNTLIDYLRKKNNQGFIHIEDKNNDSLLSIKHIGSPEENLISNQTYLEILEIIQQMPDIYREVAQLRFIQELAYEEIAHKLKLPLNTIRTRIARAKNILLNKINLD